MERVEVSLDPLLVYINNEDCYSLYNIILCVKLSPICFDIPICGIKLFLMSVSNIQQIYIV